MYEKLYRGDSLFDHEILEILLYSACPRVNTNPLAHALLERFGSLKGVFSASEEELRTVSGVGNKVSGFIKSCGECLRRINGTEGVAVLKNSADCKEFISMRFAGKKEEYLELYFLDKNGVVKRIFSYTSADRHRVLVDGAEISKNIAVNKPYYVVIAHNHITESLKPSAEDKVFTRDVQLMCALNGCKLYDHFIYSGCGILSLKDEGGLDEIKAEVNRWIKNSN